MSHVTGLLQDLPDWIFVLISAVRPLGCTRRAWRESSWRIVPSQHGPSRRSKLLTERTEGFGLGFLSVPNWSFGLFGVFAYLSNTQVRKRSKALLAVSRVLLFCHGAIQLRHRPAAKGSIQLVLIIRILVLS